MTSTHLLAYPSFYGTSHFYGCFGAGKAEVSSPGPSLNTALEQRPTCLQLVHIHLGMLDTPQVFVEGEEEIGSPGLADLLRRHSALLAADFVISTDSGQISATQGGILLGLRGMAAFEVEARTLAADVHSGASHVSSVTAWLGCL